MRHWILTASIVFFISAQAFSQTQNQPPPQRSAASAQAVNPGMTAGSSAEAKARVERETQNRVKELIKLINQEPNLLAINPKASVVKDKDWQPVTPDGKKNQDFRVAPDDSAPEISQAVMIAQNRQKWTEELVRIGFDAVPELIRAVLDPANKYRHYLVSALGQIRDLRGVPAVLKYYHDAVEEDKLANSMERLGAGDEVARMRQDVQLKKKSSVEALKLLSGKDLGEDYSKWEAWWKEMEKKIGPVQLPKLYEAQGAKPNPQNQIPPTGGVQDK